MKSGNGLRRRNKPELWQYFSEKQPMPEKMHKAMNAIYAAHPKVIGLLQKAAECPDYDAQLDYSVTPEELHCRKCFRSCKNFAATARIFVVSFAIACDRWQLR